MKSFSNKQRTEINFGELLREFRGNAGISQWKVARFLGYKSAQFVSNWERGLSEPPIETLATLAELYQISSDSMLEMYIQFRMQELEKDIRAKFPKRRIRKTA